MTFSPAQRADFLADIAVLSGVGRGQESTMYGPLRDIVAAALGYDRRRIAIDRAGSRGRPDLTVFAQGGVPGADVPWIVIEAKDERGMVADRARRAVLFEEKAKYITADTAWFVFVDPTMIVARPVERGTSDGGDVELGWATATIENFAASFAHLAAERAGVPQRLERFRAGDESLIATERLSGEGDKLAQRTARDAFFDGLRETTALLQSAAEDALGATRARRERVNGLAREFKARFHEVRFSPYPVRVEGAPRSYEESRAHGPASHALTRKLAAEPALARLALDALPRFAERVGLDPDDPADAPRIERFFAIETANLVLARILLIRFLEDHGFFDETTPDGVVRRRYLCNGGVEAFQGMHRYFGQSYTRLLEDAYRSGAGVYAAAFSETELDWVLALSSVELSRTVEWAMYRFSRYDFTTIKGDLLTGVYDRFLDPRQRKAKGEFYTPPSIARWMIERLDLAPGDSVLDPACGSGTFLIERYQQVVGEEADRGLASYDEARAAVALIAGNDLNPFSAVLTQIQLIWHLLAFGAEVKAEGLPSLTIAERANSLVPVGLRDRSTSRFGEVDRDDYAAVIGNPPYIRPERGIDLDPAARAEYTAARTVGGRSHDGISVDRNIYRLFIYRALDRWCANPAGGRPGKLAFVLPLGFCGGNDAADLRRLFAPGGRWAIREIVDMELIWRSVFDADVLPMILIAEARPAREDDRVTIHLADEACVRAPAVKGGRPSFDLDRAEASDIPYADLFAPDGRILTRLTPRRLEIIRKLRACGTLNDAAKPFWTRRRAGGQEVTAERPAGLGEAAWEEQRLIRRGATRRNQGNHAEGGLDLWKGENVRAGSFTGLPIFTSIDMASLSSPSIWGHDVLLEGDVFAIPLIEQIPCAARFDPREKAMLDTVIIFGPRDDLAHFPFDCLLVSRIFGFYSILSLRASYMNKLRSHLYQTVIAALPWSDRLESVSEKLLSARATLFAACRRRFEAGASMRAESEALGLRPLRDVFRAHAPGAVLGQSDAIADGEPFVVGEVSVTAAGDAWSVLTDAPPGGEAITVPTEELATLIAAGLRLAAGTELSRAMLLRLPVPPDLAVARTLTELSARYATDALEEAVEREVDGIDAIVGPALGLSDADIAFVQDQLANDPFLSRIRPRYPFFTPRQRGRRRNLERTDRYSRVGAGPE